MHRLNGKRSGAMGIAKLVDLDKSLQPILRVLSESMPVLLI